MHIVSIEIYANVLNGNHRVRIIHRPKPILLHTLLQKQMAVLTRLGRQNMHG